MIRRILFLLAASAVLTTPTLAWSQEQPKRNPPQQVDRTSELDIRKLQPKLVAVFKPVLAKVTPSVVQVQSNKEKAALGTVVSRDGHILTKASLLKDGPLGVKTADGKDYDATVVMANTFYDLALLKIAASNLTPVTWTDSTTTPVGHWIVAAGPGGTPIDIGVISVAARPIKPPYGRALPDEKSGMLGIRMEEAGNGQIRISTVEPGGAASKAGIQPKDILLEIRQHKIDGLDVAQNVLRRLYAGESVRVLVERDNKTVELEVVLGSRPAPKRKGSFQGIDQNQMGSELSEHRDGFPVILQHDLVLKPTECGGPLVDLDGNVIGLNIARAGRVESYTLPSEVIKKVLPDLMAPQPVGLISHVMKAAKAQAKLPAERKPTTPVTNDKAPMPREVKP